MRLITAPVAAAIKSRPDTSPAPAKPDARPEWSPLDVYESVIRYCTEQTPSSLADVLSAAGTIVSESQSGSSPALQAAAEQFGQDLHQAAVELRNTNDTEKVGSIMEQIGESFGDMLKLACKEIAANVCAKADAKAA